MELIEVCLRLGFVRILVVQDPGEIAADHEQRRQRLARSAEGTLTIMDCPLKVALASCDHSERDARFGESHRCAFGSVEVGAGLDDLGSEHLGRAVLGQMPVAVHRVEVELRRVDHEVMVKVVGVGHGFQKPAPLVERDLGLPAVPDSCPCLGFLRGELDGHAVMRSGLAVPGMLGPATPGLRGPVRSPRSHGTARRHRTPPSPPADPYECGKRNGEQFLGERAGWPAEQVIATFCYVTGPFRDKAHHTAAEQEWWRGYTEPIIRHMAQSRIAGLPSFPPLGSQDGDHDAGGNP